MLFYQVEGIMVNYDAESDDSRSARRAETKKLLVKSREFNEKHGRESFCFISITDEDMMTVGIIETKANTATKTLESYLSYIGHKLKDVVMTEITISAIKTMVSIAYHNDYIADDDEVFDKFDLNMIGKGIRFGENLIDVRTQKEVVSTAEKYLLNGTFLPELDRIYAGGPAVKPCGHPVHYMFQTDDKDTRREAYQTLLRALYANNRLSSRRYCFLNFKPGENFWSISYDALYRVCFGGAIVVRYVSNDEVGGGELADGAMETIETLCEVAKRYRNQVLTVFCLPRECTKAKVLFYENLGTMDFVEIREDFVDGEQACSFLKMLAKENRVRTDKALFAKLEEGRGYLAPELRDLFDEWYNNKLKTTMYPQYKEFRTVKREVVKAPAKGSAYEELQSMVGLSEAKAVIQKALNYYKMQSVYAERGIKKDTPAMHMVFSGNPGTAKTTAARLFARIMKDNGLLSTGQLVEVGRGDLVGKYVGWTAKTVQEKFKNAVGGVLFIDEAYSLVDDRSGSYGDEAINTIVQEMENHREDVVVIFAGYPDKMEEFLQKNPGLRSRIAFHVPFADYDAEELCEIATLMSKNKGFSLEEAAVEKLKTTFETARKQSDFGNGRYVRNVFEQAKMNQASRLLEYDFDDMTVEEITTIKAVDINVPEIKTEEKRKIGFAS